MACATAWQPGQHMARLTPSISTCHCGWPASGSGKPQ